MAQKKRNHQTSKTIDFGEELYARLDQERKRLGYRTFAEFVRYLSIHYLENHAPAAQAAAK